MPNIPLPEKSVTYSTKGFKEIYEKYRSDPQIAKAMADELESRPKHAIHHVFVTTERQRRAIESRTDDEIRELARALIDELRSESPGELEFVPSVDEEGVTRPAHVGGCIR